MATIVTILISILTFIAHASRKDQKEFNLKNSEEHQTIFNNLTVSKSLLDILSENCHENKDEINVLDKRVDNHDIVIKAIDGKVQYIYKKIE